MKGPAHELAKPPPAASGAPLQVEQEIEELPGGVRLTETVHAKEEQPDGSATEVLRETVEERRQESPWFLMGITRKTRISPVLVRKWLVDNGLPDAWVNLGEGPEPT